MSIRMRVVPGPRVSPGSTLLAAAAGVAFLVLAASPARSDSHRSGKQVVDSVCIECHGTGANGAPRIGDRKAWTNRSARGLTGLTRNALLGRWAIR
jgi:cytochrome c5